MSFDRTFAHSFLSHITEKNYHRKSSYAKPQDNLILKSIFLNSKIRLFHGLVSFQKERTSFFCNSTHMQGNEKKYLKQH